MIHQAPNPIITALSEMGYKPEIISLALAESQSSSVEDVLELLLTREAHFEDLLKAKKSQPEKKKVPFTSLVLEKPPPNDFLMKPNPPVVSQHIPVILGGLQEHETLKKDLQDLNSRLATLNSHNANDYIVYLTGALETIKGDFVKANTTPKKYFTAANHAKLAVKIKTKVFNALSKVLAMNSNTPLDLTKCQQLLLTALQLDMATPKQKEALVTLYESFCKKHRRSVDIKFIDDLHKSYNGSNINHPEQPKNNNINNNNNNHNHNHNHPKIEKKIFEESKISDNKVEEIVDVQCIICMKDIRKVVFLPCWHFLSCAGCSGKVIKCPMCDKKIEKYQKIFWS